MVRLGCLPDPIIARKVSASAFLHSVDPKQTQNGRESHIADGQVTPGGTFISEFPFRIPYHELASHLRGQVGELMARRKLACANWRNLNFSSRINDQCQQAVHAATLFSTTRNVDARRLCAINGAT